jgi:endonuclease/exonuclease/phosphatase (EEP) superfamily protein YafD
LTAIGVFALTVAAVVPPVFAVDHILTRGCTATSMRTLQVPGSDHRALVADIVMQSTNS